MSQVRSVHKSTNYQLFKFADENRNLDKKMVEKLKRSISRNNLLAVRPIVVDKNMYIIDGQHRFQAAKELQIPIYYIEDNEINVRDAFDLGSFQKCWDIEDHFKYHIVNGNEKYKQLKDLSVKYKLSLTTLLKIIFAKKRFNYETIKKGDLDISNTDFDEIDYFIQKCQDVITKIRNKSLYKSKLAYLKSPKFIISLYYFIRDELHTTTDFMRFINRIGQQADILEVKPTQDQYRRMFTRIFNYRSRNKITDMAVA